MNSSPVSRRRFLSVSTASVGGVVLSSPAALALAPSAAKDRICEIVLQHFPESAAQSAKVEQFAVDLLARRAECLEPAGFIESQLRSWDSTTLERLIVVQFATSPVYLEIVSPS